MAGVGMVTGDAASMPLVMTYNNAIRHRVELILLAEIGTQFCGFFVDCVEIGFVGQAILADLKTDMGIIDRSF